MSFENFLLSFQMRIGKVSVAVGNGDESGRTYIG